MPCLTPYYHTACVVGRTICIRIAYVMFSPFLLGNESLLALLLCTMRTCTQQELEFYWWKIETRVFKLKNLKSATRKHCCNVSGKLNVHITVMYNVHITSLFSMYQGLLELHFTKHGRSAFQGTQGQRQTGRSSSWGTTGGTSPGHSSELVLYRNLSLNNHRTHEECFKIIKKPHLLFGF